MIKKSKAKTEKMASVARIETSDERQDKNNQGNVLQELFDTMLDFVFAPWLQENSANDGSSVFSGSEVSGHFFI